MKGGGVSGEIANVNIKLGKISAKLGNVQSIIMKAAANEVYVGAEAVKERAKNSILNHESQGITYKRKNGTHTASKPGYPPNQDHGDLVKSIGINYFPQKLLAIVGTNSKVGRWLEFGTKKIAARPWLFPAIFAHEEQIKSDVKDAVQSAIKAVG